MSPASDPETSVGEAGHESGWGSLPPGQIDHPVQIILDGVGVTSPSKRRTGLQIRELGNPDRIDGFATQEINCEKGKKIRTIRDDETVELHEGECFRTVPNQGGPGAGE